MNEKNLPVLAENISALTPLDESTHQVLDQYGINEHRRQLYADKFTNHTTKQLALLEVAIALSRPQALEPVVGTNDEISISDSYKDLDLRALGINESSIDQKTLHGEVRDYEAIKHNPEKKLVRDSELVLNFLRGLGVTNPLRTPEGFDAAFELGSIKHLLQQDYETIAQQAGVEVGAYQIDPRLYKIMERRHKTGAEKNVGEVEQYRPELRLVEAFVTEQIALLWNPKAIGNIAKFPDEYRDLIANPNDPNIFPEEDIESLSVGEKWSLIGAQQCYEAAVLFKNIYHCQTATAPIRIQSLSRWIDMEIKGKLLERLLAGNEQKQLLDRSIRELAAIQSREAHSYYKQIFKQRQQNAEKYNRQNPGKRYEPTQEDKDLSAAAFESVVVAIERNRLLKQNVYNAYIRLALPGEDQIHEDIMPLIVNGNQKLNLSADVLMERLDGSRIIAFQAKAMPETAYKDISGKQEQRTGLKVVYPSKITTLRFTDSEGYTRR